MGDDLETRRRRAAWRAAHRGTKELDILIGRFAEATLSAMSATELAAFERFLAVADPLLQDWLLVPKPQVSPEHAEVVAAMRAFHGLATPSDA